MLPVNRLIPPRRLTTLTTSNPIRQSLLPVISHRQLLPSKVPARRLSYLYPSPGIPHFSSKTISYGPTDHAFVLSGSKSGESLQDVRGSLVLFLDGFFKRMGIGQEEEESEDERKKREEEVLPVAFPLDPVRPMDKKPVATPTDQPVDSPVENSDEDFVDDPDDGFFPDFVEDVIDSAGDVDIF